MTATVVITTSLIILAVSWIGIEIRMNLDKTNKKIDEINLKVTRVQEKLDVLEVRQIKANMKQ